MYLNFVIHEKKTSSHKLFKSINTLKKSKVTG